MMPALVQARPSDGLRRTTALALETGGRPAHLATSQKCRYCCKSLLKAARGGDSVSLARFARSKFDCDPCPLKPQCCPKEPQRKIPRDIHEEARDVARSLARTEAFEQSRRDRKRIEMRFAHLKRI